MSTFARATALLPALLVLGCAAPKAPVRTVGPPPTRPGAAWANAKGIPFVLIPAGAFTMGTSDAQAKELLRRFGDQGVDPDTLAPERPAHHVRITKAFLISRHEVTRGQFRQFVEAAAYKTDAERLGGSNVLDPQGTGDWIKDPTANWRSAGFPQTDGHPVVCVSWNDAQAFCAWLNDTDRTRPKGWTYRLPTEAEWEYAARGPTPRHFPWGNLWKDPHANFADRSSELAWRDADHDDGHPRTAPVGSYSPNGDSPFGAADMAGNVWEWCLDRYDEGFYKASPSDDPVNVKAGDARVERGGSWAFSKDRCRAACRYRLTPAASYDNLGFRIVLAP